VPPSPLVVAQDFRAVASRLERLTAQYVDSKDQALLKDAARLLRRIADEFAARA
jgi:hypothetical protein